MGLLQRPGMGLGWGGVFFLSKVDEVTRLLMKRDASLIAAISGAEVEVASI